MDRLTDRFVTPLKFCMVIHLLSHPTKRQLVRLIVLCRLVLPLDDQRPPFFGPSYYFAGWFCTKILF